MPFLPEEIEFLSEVNKFLREITKCDKSDDVYLSHEEAEDMAQLFSEYVKAEPAEEGDPNPFSNVAQLKLRIYIGLRAIIGFYKNDRDPSDKKINLSPESYYDEFNEFFDKFFEMQRRSKLFANVNFVDVSCTEQDAVEEEFYDVYFSLQEEEKKSINEIMKAEEREREKQQRKKIELRTKIKTEITQLLRYITIVFPVIYAFANELALPAIPHQAELYQDKLERWLGVIDHMHEDDQLEEIKKDIQEIYGEVTSCEFFKNFGDSIDQKFERYLEKFHNHKNNLFSEAENALRTKNTPGGCRIIILVHDDGGLLRAPIPQSRFWV